MRDEIRGGSGGERREVEEGGMEARAAQIRREGGKGGGREAQNGD